MLSATLAAILAAIATTAALGEMTTQSTKSLEQKSKLDDAVNKFKTDYPDVASEMTDAQIEALVGQYQDNKGWTLFSNWGHDYNVDYNELQEDLNDFYGQSWRQDNYWISLAVRRPIPGYKFNEQEFKKETNIKLLCKYETLWLGGSRYYSFEDFYKSLGYIEELYNVLLKNYKEEN